MHARPARGRTPRSRLGLKLKSSSSASPSRTHPRKKPGLPVPVPLGYFLGLSSGRVAEWLKAPDSKSGVLARVPGVQIPPLPPVLHQQLTSQVSPQCHPAMDFSRRRFLFGFPFGFPALADQTPTATWTTMPSSLLAAAKASVPRFWKDTHVRPCPWVPADPCHSSPDKPPLRMVCSRRGRQARTKKSLPVPMVKTDALGFSKRSPTRPRPSPKANPRPIEAWRSSGSAPPARIDSPSPIRHARH